MPQISKETPENLDSLSPMGFLKIFLRLYKDEYGHSYPVNFTRDCVLMSKVMNKLYMHGQQNDEVLKFIRWSWHHKSEYKKTNHNTLKLGFLTHIVDDYIKLKGFKKVGIIRDKSEEELDEEMLLWLETKRSG